jgi:hypothetical protein
LLKSDDILKKEKLIQVILKHIGGWSTFGRLKYPAEVFLKRISDNFNQFAKLLKIAPPNGLTELSSSTRGAIKTVDSDLPIVFNNIKSEFIKQAKAINPEIK